jgi:hypothetical protein
MKKLLTTKKRVKLDVKLNSDVDSKVVKIESLASKFKAPLRAALQSKTNDSNKENAFDKADQKQAFVDKYIQNYGDGTFYNGAWKSMLRDLKLGTSSLVYSINHIRYSKSVEISYPSNHFFRFSPTRNPIDSCCNSPNSGVLLNIFFYLTC